MTSFTFNLLARIGGVVFLSMINYSLCYFVTTSAINATSIADRIYDLQWYQLSSTEQFFVQMVIRRAQKPFELKGLGVFVCSLQIFLKVIQIMNHKNFHFLHYSMGLFVVLDGPEWYVVFHDIPSVGITQFYDSTAEFLAEKWKYFTWSWALRQWRNLDSSF